jgi:hypothetical protein
MDRLAQLSAELSALLDEMQMEANKRDARELMAPLAWLDEAHAWLRYEMAHGYGADAREPVPFTYIPLSMRKRTDAASTQPH